MIGLGVLAAGALLIFSPKAAGVFCVLGGLFMLVTAKN